MEKLVAKEPTDERNQLMGNGWEPLSPEDPSLALFAKPIGGHKIVDDRVSAGIEITRIIPTEPTHPKHAPATAVKTSLFSRTSKKEREAIAAEQRAALLEASYRKDLRIIEEHTAKWRRSPTIVVGNSKGGVGKTVTAVLLSQAFAAAAHIVVAVVDNNEEGNQRDRMPNKPDGDTQTIDHLAEVVEAGAQLDRATLKRFMMRQPEGYWALPSVTGQTKTLESGKIGKWEYITPSIWLEIHTAIAEQFDLVIVDSGTAQRASNHEAAFDVADVLVTPMRWNQDGMVGMQRLIADKFKQDKALGTAPVIVEMIIRDDEKAARKQYLARLQEQYPGAAFAPLPFDEHLASADAIRWESLAQQTRQAAVHMAAVVCQALDSVADLRVEYGEA